METLRRRTAPASPVPAATRLLCTAAALLVCASIGGCGATPAALAWKRRLDAQPHSFLVHRDSADRAFERAERWLRDNAAAREVRSLFDRIETHPYPEGAQQWFSVERQAAGDSVRFVVDYRYEPRQPSELLNAVIVPDLVDDLALHVATGETFGSFASRFVPDSAIVAEAMRAAEERPDRLWLSFGHGPYDLAFEAGFRRDWYGFSYGAADFGAPYDPVPAFDSTLHHPTDPSRRESFRGLFSGLNLYGFLDLTDELSLYASAGLYVRVDTELEREESTGAYYQSGSATAWHDPTPSLGAGLQFSIGRRLVVDAGFAIVSGLHGGLGWRF